MMETTVIKKRGGARPGSGQPKKYACETKVLGFRVPIEFEEEIKTEVQSILKRYERVK